MTSIFWAILSALFAAATALLAKVGVEGIDSNLATAIRTTVVLVFTWTLALSLNAHRGIGFDWPAKLDVSGFFRPLHRTLAGSAIFAHCRWGPSAESHHR